MWKSGENTIRIESGRVIRFIAAISMEMATKEQKLKWFHRRANYKISFNLVYTIRNKNIPNLARNC